MKSLKVKIEFDIKGDPADEHEIKELIYCYLGEAIEAEELDYDVVDDSEDEDL